MRFSVLQSILLLAAPLVASGAPFQRNSMSASCLGERNSLFGVSALSQIVRGGAQESEEAEGETLYLPELLDAELASSADVSARLLCRYPKSFLIFHCFRIVANRII